MNLFKTEDSQYQNLKILFSGNLCHEEISKEVCHYFKNANKLKMILTKKHLKD